jgi:hypothetical protein
LRGRVMSVYMMVFAGSAPFGALLAGAIAGAINTSASVFLGGVVTLSITLLLALRTGALSRQPAPFSPFQSLQTKFED